jgi:hypothetical protein
LSSAQSAAVQPRPRFGINQKLAASTPSTAPNVLAEYSLEIERPAPGAALGVAAPGVAAPGVAAPGPSAPGTATLAASRSIAGSVAPIAAVAGKSNANVPKNATDHCHTGEGITPSACCTPPLNAGHATSKS